MAENIQDRNTRIAKEAIRCLERTDIKRLSEILNADAEVHIMGDLVHSRTMHVGQDVIDAFLAVGGDSGQKWRYNIADTVAQDDKVAIRVHELTRMAGSGKLYDVWFFFLFKFKDDGTIYEWIEHGDTDMIRWALNSEAHPWPPIPDEERIARFIEEHNKFNDPDALPVSEEDFEFEFTGEYNPF